MNSHGDSGKNSAPEVPPALAAAALVVFAHRHEVVHLLYAAADEIDAARRIGGLLQLDEDIVQQVLDQPLRWMLPQFREELESMAAHPKPGVATQPTPATPAKPPATAATPPPGSASRQPTGAPTEPPAATAPQPTAQPAAQPATG